MRNAGRKRDLNENENCMHIAQRGDPNVEMKEPSKRNAPWKVERRRKRENL